MPRLSIRIIRNIEIWNVPNLMVKMYGHDEKTMILTDMLLELNPVNMSY